MAKSSPTLIRPDRAPPPVDGLQVNFCKNPRCKNFGIPPRLGRAPRGPHVKIEPDYRAVGVGNGLPGICCMHCGETPMVKSNLAVAQERDRMLQELESAPPPACRTAGCPNTVHPVPSAAHYARFGRTAGGSPRFRCKACKKMISMSMRSTLRQRQEEKNHLIFALLMNKSPMRRLCEVADIKPETLYQRIGFFHEQCRLFGAQHESRLLAGFQTDRMYIAVDRQDYVVNWSSQSDRRNVTLHAVGSADQRSGYVFGMHLDFDRNADAGAIEADHDASPELHIAWAFRRYARLWLKADYHDALRTSRRMRKVRERARMISLRDGPGVIADIDMNYQVTSERQDTEISEDVDFNSQLPNRGMQVHSEYTLYGHFFFLERLLRGVGKVRFYLDQESGIRAACLSAFCQRVKDRTVDAFYVRIDKSLTVNERRRQKALSDERFEAAKARFPSKTNSEVQVELIKERLAAMTSIGKWSDRWLLHPFPSMSEPEKAVCYLTDLDSYDQDHLAHLYRLASLHSIDRFFMQLRRRVSLFERPIATASAQGRVWHGYSPYNPIVADKLLGIFRVFYNYVAVGQDRQTPAMRLGLAEKPYQIQDLIDFMPKR